MSKTEEKINKYDNSKIFKIISDTQPDKVYYGSTLEKSLRKVLSIHKTKYKKYIEDNNSVDYIPSFELLKNGDAEIILVEKFKCNDVDEYNQKLHNFINEPKNPNINRYRPEGYKKPVKKPVNKTQKGGKLPDTTETDAMTDIKPILKSDKLPNTEENIQMFSLQKLLLPKFEDDKKEVKKYSIGGKTYTVKDGYVTIGDNHIELSKLESYSFEKRLKVLKYFEDKLNH